jgi:hypothetical protein
VVASVVNNVDSRLTLTFDDELTIVNVSRSDASTYSCRAYNTIGATTKTYTLIVQVPAEIVDLTPSNVTVTAGSTLTFKCSTTGEPGPIVRWLRVVNGETRAISREEGGTDGQEEGDGRFDADGSRLTIHNITVDDEGQYICEATNAVGPPQRQTAVVDVLGEFYVDVTSVDDAPLSYSRGASMTLLCNVTGDVTDDVNVTWSKDGRPLADDVGSRYNVTSHGRVLHVANMGSPDAGKYQCTAVRGSQQALGFVDITIQGKQLPAGCIDRPWLANCRLLVEASLCHHPYYRIFCCQSCFEAGQLIT